MHYIQLALLCKRLCVTHFWSTENDDDAEEDERKEGGVATVC